MSNFNLAPPVERMPNPKDPACPLRALSKLAVESATTQAESMRLKILRDVHIKDLRDKGEEDIAELLIEQDSTSDLDERLLELSGDVRTIVGDDYQLYNTYQSNVTTHLLDAFREVRIKYAKSLNL